jgi:hypothetical protein
VIPADPSSRITALAGESVSSDTENIAARPARFLPQLALKHDGLSNFLRPLQASAQIAAFVDGLCGLITGDCRLSSRVNAIP